MGTILFCKNAENAVKKNNSPRFTAFTAKRCKKYAVKIIFFSPHFTAFLTKIHHQTSTRVKCQKTQLIFKAVLFGVKKLLSIKIFSVIGPRFYIYLPFYTGNIILFLFHTVIYTIMLKRHLHFHNAPGLDSQKKSVLNHSISILYFYSDQL